MGKAQAPPWLYAYFVVPAAISDIVHIDITFTCILPHRCFALGSGKLDSLLVNSVVLTETHSMQARQFTVKINFGS